jgi:hypothetical protein
MKGSECNYPGRMTSFNAYYSNISAVNSFVRQHLPSVEWLVSTRDEDRGTGRTTALALAFLRNSFSSAHPTRAFDHADGGGFDSKQWIKMKLQEMSPGLFIGQDGTLESQPAYAASPSSPQFNDTLLKVRQDFMSVVTSAVRLGVDPTWMMKQLQNALAESVMNT